MRTVEKRLSVPVAAVLFAATIGLLVILGGRSAQADPGAPNPGHGWAEVEDHGIDVGTGDYWLGPTVDQALELRVNDARALRIEPDATSPNLIGGSSANSVSGYGATISGGGTASKPNSVTGNLSTVGGGAGNTAGGSWATVAGGEDNSAGGGTSTVGGGWSNSASNTWATVGGGYDNTANGMWATVAGGAGNAASGSWATVGGGQANTAGSSFTTVAGGDGNLAAGDYATVGGGDGNTAGNFRATVSGGESNTASGQYATIAGGSNNIAAGDYSFAAGRQAKADGQGCFVWADSTAATYRCATSNRFQARANGGVLFDVNNSESVKIYDDGTDLIDTTANGARLTLAGVWTDGSDAASKENFTSVDGHEVLASVAELSITTWSSKAQDASVRHMGPTAQDFYAAFGLGEDDLHIASLDTGGVALAAIQGLYELSQEQDARIDTLEARVTALEGGAPLERGSESLLSSVMPGGWLLLAGLFVLGGLVVVQRRLRGVGR